MIDRHKGNGQIETVRPSFNWSGPLENGRFDTKTCIGQLTEDIRNILEQIRDKQMLQCDVREDIRLMRRALERIAASLPKKRKRRTRRRTA